MTKHVVPRGPLRPHVGLVAVHPGMDPSRLGAVPANAPADIASTTVFGALACAADLTHDDSTSSCATALQRCEPGTGTRLWMGLLFLRETEMIEQLMARGLNLVGPGHYYETYDQVDGQWRIKTSKLARLRDITTPLVSVRISD